MNDFKDQGEYDEATFRAELEGKFDYVRYIFADIPGTCRHKLIPVRHAVKAVETSMYSGIVALGPLTEVYAPDVVEQKNYPNGILRPMAGTLRPAPWASTKHKTAMVICEMFWMDGRIQEVNPRTVARRQLARLSSMGYSLYSGFETEFVIESEDAQKPLFPTPDYCEMLSFKPLEEFFMDLDQHLVKADVDLEYVHTEHGAGQFETTLFPKYGIDSADQAFILKNTVKELVSEKNLIANYMAKPVLGGSGSGVHLNFSLWDEKAKTNVFHNKDGADRLSDIARWWLGGLVRHADAVCALVNPTVNCYRRIHEPWAPDYNDWNVDDRVVCYRVKNRTPTMTYFENRLPSSLSNPYIVLAATIAAGLDGINRKIEPPPKGRADAKRLPSSLAEALDFLEKDDVLCGALGQEFISWFLGNKRAIDLKVHEMDPDPMVAEYKEYARLS